LLLTFYRRKKTKLEVSIDVPFPAEKLPKPAINVIKQAIEVHAYMQTHPEETCLSASKTLNLHRKRISRLLKLVNTLPPEFINQAKDWDDQKILRQMSIKELLNVGQGTDIFDKYIRPTRKSKKSKI